MYLGDVAVAVHTVSTTAFAYHPTTGGGVYTIEVEVSHYSLISEAASITVEYGILCVLGLWAVRGWANQADTRTIFHAMFCV